MLDGEISFFIADEPGVEVGAGAFAHIPGGTVHGFRLESETARYLILTTPQHGEFYKAITLAAGTDGGAPPESVTGEQIQEACAKYGVEFVGPLPRLIHDDMPDVRAQRPFAASRAGGNISRVRFPPPPWERRARAPRGAGACLLPAHCAAARCAAATTRDSSPFGPRRI